MLSETEVLEMLTNEMEELRKAKFGDPKTRLTEGVIKRIESVIDTLVEVLDGEHNFYTLVNKAYSLNVKLAVAHIARDEIKRPTLPVVVSLYGRNPLTHRFERWATTDGWVVTEIDESAPPWKSKNRQLYVPSVFIIQQFGDTYGETFFDTNNQPVVSYLHDTDPNQPEIYTINWTNIQTGERLHKETPQP